MTISNEADGEEFLDDNNYVMNRDIDDNSDSHNEEEDEEETDIKDNNNDNGSIDYDTVDDNDNDEEAAWYNIALLMLDCTQKFLPTYCVHPGFAISMDEMMKLFKGHSNMTHIMKCKPVLQCYKFYVMCCAQSSYCFLFFPDGLYDKKKRMIYKLVVWCVCMSSF